MAFTVAIVGRPNVGKSTLFNRLVGRRLALVDDTPGVTRDRREAEARIGDSSVRLIDTAGLETAGAETLQGRMTRQTEAAIAEADLVLFVIDARVGITPSDEHFAALVRTSGRPVALLANKAESRGGRRRHHGGVLARLRRSHSDLGRARHRHSRRLRRDPRRHAGRKNRSRNPRLRRPPKRTLRRKQSRSSSRSSASRMPASPRWSIA